MSSGRHPGVAGSRGQRRYRHSIDAVSLDDLLDDMEQSSSRVPVTILRRHAETLSLATWNLPESRCTAHLLALRLPS